MGWLPTSRDEPVGWHAVEPRTEYDGLLRVFRVPWDGRDETYPITSTAVISEELPVGPVPTFEAAGPSVVSRPIPRRDVTRIDY